MKTFNYIYITLLAFLGISCYKQNTVSLNSSIETITINNKLNFNFNKKFKLAKFIPLETNTNCLITDIIKIILTDKIYIQDRNSKIFIFNIDGKFINKIDSKGYGPTEYTSISDFTVNDSIISIIDTNEKRLMKYDLKGEFVEEIKLPLEILYYHDTKEFDLRYTGNIGSDLTYDKSNNKFHKLLFNKQNIIENKYLPFDPKLNGYIYRTQSPFYQQNNKLYFIEPINDTIYSIEENKLISKYVVDFGKHKRPNDFFKETLPENIYSEMVKNNYIKSIVSFYNFTNIIYFNAYIGKEHKHVIYDKKSKNSIMTSSLWDIENNIPVTPMSYLGEQNYLMSVLSSNDIIENDDINLDLNIHEENNPIIFLYEFIK